MSTSRQKPKISVLLPVHNEVLQIKRCIQEVGAATGCFSDSYEIIVSEDGSTDGTDVVLSELALSDPHLRVMHSEIRLGKGKAIKKGIEQASGEIIFFMDADLAASLEYLPRLLEEVQKHGGLAIGSRHVKGSIVKRHASRTFSSLIYNLFVRLLFLDGIHDHQCGFKAMSRKAAKSVLDVKSNGFFFDTEMILRCRRQGFQVVEVGIEWVERRGSSKSKVRVFQDAKRMGFDLLMFRLTS